jgi:integrase
MHKTEHHGHQRIIAIGPRAQEVIRPFLTLDTQAYLFSPRAAMEDRNADRRRNRKTPMTPSQAARTRKRRPRKAPGDRYTTSSYGHAVAKACAATFPPPEPLARRADETAGAYRERLTAEEHAEVRRWHREHRWHPHQLRHTKATEIRREAGIDAARAVLGHRSPAITETYAELDMGKAAAIMERIG